MGICFLLMLTIFHSINTIPVLYYDSSAKSKMLSGLFCLPVLAILLSFFISSLTKESIKGKYFFVMYCMIPIVFVLQSSVYTIYPFFGFEKRVELELYISAFIILMYLYLSIKYALGYSTSHKGSLWLLKIIALFACLCIIYILLNTVFLKIQAIYFSGIISLNLLSFLLCSILSYTIFTNNYCISIKISNIAIREESDPCGSIDQMRFEKYVKEHKPYLNSELKMSDFTKYVGTNRTYLSHFINKNYGMNFRAYINMLRLEEFRELKSSLHHKGLSEEELVYMAGFKSYKSYKKMIENLK
ncbi:helix-turn-helix domain-containing protein [Chryseobacterium sp. StRB126]|uniref:helix-turn-helix domain-containing protein n=1 Tax=Chryseobacterium sp. StRB126 TaxID=878220 RepID=UPI000AD30598|nr:AraC family transcriptional regulator [Chryseobacterium sp. StRB126]